MKFALIDAMKNQFESNANAKNAMAMKAYMRDQFDYYGIKAPIRKQIFKEVLKKIGKPNYSDHFRVAKVLYSLPQREFHLCAIELSGLYKREWDSQMPKQQEFLATHNSWWDTVDATNSIIGGPYFLKFPKERKRLEAWNKSNNRWLIRLSIIFQLHYHSKTDPQLLKKFILPHLESEEFFIQKAIGWSLRAYSRTDAQWVMEFIEQNPMKPLSKREALKLLK